MRKVLVLNGPNLGRLGSRQPEIYGGLTYAGLADHLVETGRPLGFEVDVRQTDNEAEMIGWLHEAADEGTPVVLNAGAWTHYSHAVADAAALVPFYVEVHISNVHAVASVDAVLEALQDSYRREDGGERLRRASSCSTISAPPSRKPSEDARGC